MTYAEAGSPHTPTPPHTHLLISSPFFPPYACSNSALLHWCGRKNDLFGTLLLAAGLREAVQKGFRAVWDILFSIPMRGPKGRDFTSQEKAQCVVSGSLGSDYLVATAGFRVTGLVQP